MSDAEDTLPFSETKQNAVLGHVIMNTDNFCSQAMAKIKPTWFRSGYNSKLYGYVQRLYTQNGGPPTATEIRTCTEMRSEDLQMQNKLKSAMSLAIQGAVEIRLKAIVDDLQEWMQAKPPGSPPSVRVHSSGIARSLKRVPNGSKKSLVKDYYDASFSRDSNEVQLRRAREVLGRDGGKPQALPDDGIEGPR